VSEFGGRDRVAAIQRFRQARRKADLVALLSKLTGKREDLLPFDEVRKTLSLTHPKREELRDIPLDSIVGSVNRYYDFTRQFYPLDDSDQDRWARVNQLVEEKGLDPIEVYQVGDVYFVMDGNHRVSVARQMGSKTIQAYVKEFSSAVEVKPEDDILDVVLRLEHKELMEETKLDKVRPEIDFKVTVVNRYNEIKEHIAVHRYYLSQEQHREVPIEEAAASWVDNYYLPGIRVIRDHGILQDFPGRTETDLYLWLRKHQSELEESLNQQITDHDAAHDLSERFGQKLWQKINRFFSNLVKRD
jgi:hypothetical protein